MVDGDAPARRTRAGDTEVEAVYRLTRNVVIPWMHVWFRWHVEGLENIPRSGPALVASNHIAYLDPLAVAYVIDRAGRRPRFLSKSELFQDRRIAWVLRGCGQIEVKRGTPSAPAALDDALVALDRGEVVAIFPEGTVTTDPELRPMPVKSGIARLALRTGAPVVPCGVWGTANVWPKGHAHDWRPGQDIAVRVGEPLWLSGNPDDVEDWQAAGRAIMDAIGALVASIKPAIPDRRRPRRATA